MNETELNQLVVAWVEAQNSDEGSPEYERNWWAIERVQGLSLRNYGEDLWQFILAVYQRDIPARVASMVAAGPLEDLIVYDGPQFIDRVEELARTDSKFNWLLGGVWLGDPATADVSQRIQAVRQHVW